MKTTKPTKTIEPLPKDFGKKPVDLDERFFGGVQKPAYRAWQELFRARTAKFRRILDSKKSDEEKARLCAEACAEAQPALDAAHKLAMAEMNRKPGWARREAESAAKQPGRSPQARPSGSVSAKFRKRA